MKTEKIVSISISLTLLFLAFVFAGQGIFYIIEQKKNNLPKKMLIIGSFNIIIAFVSLMFALLHFLQF